MGTGYLRQSTGDIIAGNVVEASPLNDEFNQLQSAFNASSGHSHDGTTGEGPKISLTSSITGILPVANGGIAGIHKLDGTTAPTANEDSGDGYVVGSLWVDTTNDAAYVCVDSTLTAAVWLEIPDVTGYQPLDATLTALAALSTAADKMIYATASDTFATTDLTSFARSILDDANEATFKATVNLEIGTDVQAYNANLTTYATVAPTAAGLALLDDLNAAAQLVTLGLTATASELNTLDGITSTVAELNILDGVTSTAAELNILDGATLDVTELNYVDGVTSAIQTQLDGKQASDAELSAIAGLTSAADRLPYFTGSGTASLATFTSTARSLLDDASTSAMRTTLGVAIGSDVQAYDADLAAIAALVDPNADRLMFWDDSAGQWTHLTLGSGLVISGTTLRHYETIQLAISDEETALDSTGTAMTFRMPFAMTLTEVRASVTTASSSGTPTFDINEGGSTILSTKLTIDQGEKTSTTAATAAVISDSSLADDAEITIDVDVTGTNTAGAKITLIGYRT